MRTFRGKEVIGWKVVNERYAADLEKELNKLMDKYEFIDCQYCATENSLGMGYSALVLIAKKTDQKVEILVH